jgi:hypothetical protein
MPRKPKNPEAPEPPKQSSQRKKLAKLPPPDYRKGPTGKPGGPVRAVASTQGTPQPHILVDVGAPATDVTTAFAADYVNAYTIHRIRKLAHEMAKRRAEALNLFEPLDGQKEFFASKVPYRLVRGSNRAGKTLCAAVEVARAACGSDPHGKYPGRDGTAFLVGKDQKHVAKVIYAKLFRPGAFKIIRDKGTGRWRAYRPWDYEDAGRAQEARLAPPLIPERLVREVAWENKKENVPSVVRLTNGWELFFFSSLGKPPQGSPIDLFWLDEEIVDPAWYPELAARVVDRRGRGIWSATPQAGTDQLYELHERAEKERAQLAERDRRIAEFVVLLEDNRHIDEAAKRALAADLSEEEARVRIGGEYAVTSYKVYPNFNMLVHGWPEMEVPAEWTRYAYIDPGHRVCAVLFAAVPPPGGPDIVLLYRELYIQEASAAVFAAAMKAAVAGEEIQAFVMDMNMGRHTELGTGKTVAQQYSEALVKEGVKSRATGYSFLPAADDVQAGVMAVQGMLRVRDGEAGPKLRVMQGRLPNFEYEIKRYHRKRVAGVVKEEPDNRKANHLMDDLRYMALHGPKHVPSRPPATKRSPAVEYLKRKEDRRLARDGGGAVNLGPGKGAIWK